MAEDLASWQISIEKSLRDVFPGLTRLSLCTGGECYPQDPGLVELLGRLKGLGASELLLEGDAGKALIVKYDYDDTGAAAYYANGLDPADLSRYLQVMLAARDHRRDSKAYMPLKEVERLAGQWQRRIAFVFGDGYASRLVERALSGMDRCRLMPGDIDAARALISSALGDCIFLEKVNK
jgi:hypothetical protein